MPYLKEIVACSCPCGEKFKVIQFTEPYRQIKVGDKGTFHEYHGNKPFTAEEVQKAMEIAKE